jgi:peptidoglycan/LPS O-acetylase OafA/YrhL
MAAFFALGLMSVALMALFAALIALQKLLPGRRIAVASTPAVLLVLAIALLAVPHESPGSWCPAARTGQRWACPRCHIDVRC